MRDIVCQRHGWENALDVGQVGESLVGSGEIFDGSAEDIVEEVVDWCNQADAAYLSCKAEYDRTDSKVSVDP